MCNLDNQAAGTFRAVRAALGDSLGKYGQHWPSLVGKLDSPTGFRTALDSGKEEFLNRRWEETCPLVMVLATDS